MIQDIKSLIEFAETSQQSDVEQTAPWLRAARLKHNYDDLVLGCCALLQWLQVRPFEKKLGPLTLPKAAPWASALRDVVAGSAQLSGLFIVSETQLDLSPDISAATQREIDTTIQANYRPELND